MRSAGNDGPGDHFPSRMAERKAAKPDKDADTRALEKRLSDALGLSV